MIVSFYVTFKTYTKFYLYAIIPHFSCMTIFCCHAVSLFEISTILHEIYTLQSK